MSTTMQAEYSPYETPKDLLADRSISNKEKIRLLKIWQKDEEALIRASSEGLSGGEDNQLKAVQNALDSLGV